MSQTLDEFLFPPVVDLNSLEVAVPGKPVVVGIAGGSGSGKTTMTKALLDCIGASNITFICHDSYYKDLSHLTPEERDARNFDHPESLDSSLLLEHLQQLKRGEEVRIPVYDYKTHTRLPGEERIAAKSVILVEGVLIFADASLVDEFDIKIFVDTDSDIRFIRRLQRDIVERQRTAQSVIDQYMSSVRPMHELYVEPSKKRADVIIPAGYNAVALELVVHRLRSVIFAAEDRR